ncbi:GNAT family N-acetyltransferase [Fusibacter paucivorans]|uniref:GNAT family N-acetyltransferase n=1 Tax=Fusibacter paucivorans TaxID=76009 RepID=A0ABS5PSN7_9FIRM|nr:GNAT family N-acetyltransferase [Fusibacter paucivorans]MBS7528108.1 GNAT family N-acetyltransferase [Fusibacter paucivorans]
MEKHKKDVNIGFVSEVDLNENSKEIIELLNDNYLINFPNHHDLSNFAISNFNDMKKYINNGSALVVGAYSRGKVIGFLWAYRRLFLGEERLHISHIVVDAKFRGYGIGSRMIDFIEQYALKNEIKIIELLTTSKNERTIEFYNKHGFSVTRVQFEKNLGEKDDN